MDSRNAIAAFILGMLLFSTSVCSQNSEFQIEISDIDIGRGTLVVEIYADENSWLSQPVLRLTHPTNKKIALLSFELPPGEYGISTFQDYDEDEELDQNFIGIPKEPIAFGNNYKPFGTPKFDDAAVLLNEKNKLLKLTLYSVL
jgi:uncharacterized protein (DUF2141 family)